MRMCMMRGSWPSPGLFAVQRVDTKKAESFYLPDRTAQWTPRRSQALHRLGAGSTRAAI